MRTLFLFLYLLNSVQNLFSQPAKSVPYLKIDTVLIQKMSVRAILVDQNKLWFAADQNRFGYYDIRKKKVVERQLDFQNNTFEFRSIAQTKKSIFIANVGSPACIFKIDKKTLRHTIVYQDNHPNAFFDSMHFLNNKTGIVLGDPTEDCLSVLLSQDGGNHWQKIACKSLPKTVKGEAAFAASNSNICFKKDTIWIISGGNQSRLFYSNNQKDFNAIELPIVQGLAMSGAFTMDFYDEQTGFIAGGNYEKPEQNHANKLLTTDGGKNWKTVADGTGFGYASCIQFVPQSGGKKLVCVGLTGLYYSDNYGTSWLKLSDDATLFTIRFLNSNTFFVAGKDKILQLELN